MSELTEEAREKFGPWMRFRLKLASFVISLGYTIMPQPYWDDVQREELKEMAERMDMDIRPVHSDNDQMEDQK